MRQIPKKICTMPPFPPLPTPGNISIKIAPSTPTTHGQYLCILKSLFLLSVEIGSKCDANFFFKAAEAFASNLNASSVKNTHRNETSIFEVGKLLDKAEVFRSSFDN